MKIKSMLRQLLRARFIAVWTCGFLILGIASALWAEDCIPINPDQVEAKLVQGRWKVVQGNMWIMDFNTSQANAVSARDTIKHYRMTQQCFIGRPNPPMTYFRTATGFPQGPRPGQDLISFNPYNVKAVNINGHWKVVDCDHWMLDFGASQANAQAAVSLIQANRLRYMGFIGRPNPGMSFWLADPAFKPVTEVSLNVALIPQETRNWCWAASAEMAMEFLGGNVQQCDEANKEFGRNDCCTIQRCPNPVYSHACVTGGWPEYSKYGFSSKRTSNTALTWEQLWEQIYCKRAPVAFSWHWSGGGGHMMVVRGLQILPDGTKMVEINDPWAPCTGDHRFITYNAYVQVANDHTHWDDFYDLKKGAQ
jgi:hypothetical protein